MTCGTHHANAGSWSICGLVMKSWSSKIRNDVLPVSNKNGFPNPCLMNWEYRNAPLISSVAFRDGRPLLYDCCLHCPTLLFCIWAQVIRKEWLVLVGCILVPDLSLSFVSAFDGMACPVAESKANLNIRNVSDKSFTKMIYFYISILY